MKHHGKISEWNDDRGFGFIAPFQGRERVFVHISAFPVGGRRPVPDDVVIYTIGRDKLGRIRAEAVRYLLDTREATTQIPAPRGNGDLVAGCIAVGFLTLVSLAAVVGRLWWPVVGAYVGMSALTFVAYKHDKLAAQAGAWRTKEWTLIVLGLVGGWPGALVAQQRFRHKTRKRAFQLGFWLSVVANVTGLGLLVYA